MTNYQLYWVIGLCVYYIICVVINIDFLKNHCYCGKKPEYVDISVGKFISILFTSWLVSPFIVISYIVSWCEDFRNYVRRMYIGSWLEDFLNKKLF